MNIGKAILHIPHSRTVIPEEYLSDYLISKDELHNENQVMADLYTDSLFPAQSYPSLIFPYSRLFVDVERFRDDAEESMSARGMGVLYERGHDLRRIRKPIDPGRRLAILVAYYDTHHARLTSMVEKALQGCGSALIIDCHSFPATRLPYNNPEDRDRPEICIGTDSFHSPPDLRDCAVEHFRKLGYSVEVDFPFSGSITPLKHYGKNSRVQSIMIEVRRDLFIDPGTYQLTERFAEVQENIEKLIGVIELAHR